jgi:hypothetical protein
MKYMINEIMRLDSSVDIGSQGVDWTLNQGAAQYGYSES